MTAPYIDPHAEARALAALDSNQLDVADSYLLQLTHRPDWQQSAACRNEDPRLFFPTGGQSAGRAKAICARCPVTRQCADFSLSFGRPLDGVWGGDYARHHAAKRAPREAA